MNSNTCNAGYRDGYFYETEEDSTVFSYGQQSAVGSDGWVIDVAKDIALTSYHTNGDECTIDADKHKSDSDEMDDARPISRPDTRRNHSRQLAQPSRWFDEMEDNRAESAAWISPPSRPDSRRNDSTQERLTRHHGGSTR